MIEQAIGLFSLLVTAVGFVAAVLKVKQLTLDIRKLRKELTNLRERDQTLVRPTLNQILSVNGDMERFQREQEEKQREREREKEKEKHTSHAIGPLQPVAILYLLWGALFLPLALTFGGRIELPTSFQVPSRIVARMSRTRICTVVCFVATMSAFWLVFDSVSERPIGELLAWAYVSSLVLLAILAQIVRGVLAFWGHDT